MKLQLGRSDKYTIYRASFTLLGVVLNVVPAYIFHRLGLPFYADILGTVMVAMLCGDMSGIVTAVATSVLCSVFNSQSIYYTLIGIMIAYTTAIFVQKEMYHRRRYAGILILMLALISGVIGTVFQWILNKGPQFTYIAQMARYMAADSETGFFFASMFISTILNMVEKGVLTLAAIGIIVLVPAELRKKVHYSVWRQKALSDREIREIRGRRRGSARSISTRLTLSMTFGAIILVSGAVYLSLNMYSQSVIEQYSNSARNAAIAAASALDTDLIDSFVKKGKSSPGYRDTERRLYTIKDNAYGVRFLYVVKPLEEGFRVVFDLDTEYEDGYEPGEIMEYDPKIKSQRAVLFAGEEPEAYDDTTKYGYMLTKLYPVRDDKDKTVCYVGVDMSLDTIGEYRTQYLIKIVMVFSGFFILVLGFGLWLSDHYLTFPIGSMASMIEGFSLEEEEQSVLDENVRKLRTLKIRTNDEVEILYHAICQMASGGAEQLRSIRHFADSTARMQNGLIVTMADLVENRDSDTGAHIQKTAAYVKIIAEGLRRKGYYVEKLTPKFISDVVMSAPLHDVGKINISDTVLNKPGKLTDEEYEIMKTHTVHGREIMEKAISTVQGESYLKEARNMAAYHHERWDGKGYPEGLHGQVIPLSARIMAVADVFDALVSPRVYKPAFSVEKAVQIIEEGAGTQFDPKCVEVFLESLPDVKRIMIKYMED